MSRYRLVTLYAYKLREWFCAKKYVESAFAGLILMAYSTMLVIMGDR